MTLGMLELEFRFHFGDDEEAASRVYDAWMARTLELFSRTEIYAASLEMQLRQQAIPLERYPPLHVDSELAQEWRDQFIATYTGKLPRPEPDAVIERLYVDRDAFAAWSRAQSMTPKPGRPKDAADDVVQRLIASWGAGELGAKTLSALDDAIMKATGVSETTARTSRRRFGIGQGLAAGGRKLAR